MTNFKGLFLSGSLVLFVMFMVLLVYGEYIMWPITGVSCGFYMISVWFLSIWVTIMVSQNIQQYKHIHIELFYKIWFNYPTKQSVAINSLEALVSDIDKHYISSWYGNITKEENFVLSTKILIEDLLKKLLKTQCSSNSKLLIHGILHMYLKHLKEFKRAIKRKQKFGGHIEEQYRYSHVCSTSPGTEDYFINQLTTNILNHFVNWELRNSLPYYIIVSILSRKLLLYILKLFSLPKYLNYMIMNIVTSPATKDRLKINTYGFINLTDNEFKKHEVKDVETHVSAKRNISTEESDKKNQKEDFVTTFKSKDIAYKEIKQSPKTEDNDIKADEEIKKVWELWEDIASDLSFIPVVSSEKPAPIFCKPDTSNKPDSHALSKINTKDHKSETATLGSHEFRPKSLLDEVESLTSAATGNMHLLQNFRDFTDSTVNNVVKPSFNKIGDLQDEAASVVEGILDFGKAGFHKGLKQFGQLQEQQLNKIKLAPKLDDKSKLKSELFSQTFDKLSIEKAATPQEEFNKLEVSYVTTKEQEKQNNPTSEDSKTKLLPIISMDLSDTTDSPDPEYEEPVDLAATIAKLRSLLQQKSSESNLSTPALSPMPPEDFAQKILFDSDEPFVEVNGQEVPSFYKLCAKTATGVLHKSLNTIKTALPGNVQDSGSPVEGSININWNFTSAKYTDEDLVIRMSRLLSERKVFCTVDTAFEAIESLKQADDQVSLNNLQIEDDFEDEDLKIPITRVLVDIICELLLETGTTVIQEPIINLLLLIFGYNSENAIITKFNLYIQKLVMTFQNIPKNREQILEFTLEDFGNCFMNEIPDFLKYSIGEESLKKAVLLFISSLQFQKINEDTLLQILEFMSLISIKETKDDPH